MRTTHQHTSHEKKSIVALKAFFGISKKWNLTCEHECILLGTSRATYFRWKKLKDILLDTNTLERISYILGIYKALRILLPTEFAANAWIHQPNKAYLFGGHSALEKMLKGRVIDLADVRRYLDAERG